MSNLFVISKGYKVIIKLFIFSYYSDVGNPTFIWQICGVIFWYGKRQCKDINSNNPTFSLCCYNVKIRLSIIQNPPTMLYDLIFGDQKISKHFEENIRSFNMFCFTSMGGYIDKSVNTGSAPPVFRLHGQNYHRIGSLLPGDGQRPNFSQL